MNVDNEKAIRAIVSGYVESYASGFSDKTTTKDVQYLCNDFLVTFDKKLCYHACLLYLWHKTFQDMLGKIAMKIATLHYKVSQHVEGVLYKNQTDYIAEILEDYKNHARSPQISDYLGISKKKGEGIHKRHESEYYLLDEDSGMHYLIELKIGGDLDNKEARSEKEALLEQYCILTNQLGSEDHVKILFATAYNRYGEGRPWTQGRVLQFFSNEELCISRNFWNLVCKSERGFDIVMDEYKKNAHYINEALNKINGVYLPD